MLFLGFSGFLLNILYAQSVDAIANLFPIPGAFDAVGSTELKDAGKAGLVTVQGKISAVLGTVLVCESLCTPLKN